MSFSINKKINLHQLFYILILIPFIVPGYLNGILSFYLLYRIMLLLSFIIIFLLYIKKVNKSVFVPLILVYCIIRFISALLNETLSLNLIIDLIRITSICMLVDYVVTQKKYREWLNSLTILFRILIIINLVLLFIFPEGLALGRWDTRINFLGSDNTIATLLIPMIPIFILNSKLRKDNKQLLDLSLILLTLLLTWSGTGIGGLILLSGYVLFSTRFIWIKTMNVWVGAAIVTGIFTSIIIFRVQYLFAFFIEDFLKKDLSFTNRTNVWDQAINLINKQTEDVFLFLLGYGHRQLNIINEITNGLYAHAHNEFLEITLESGFLGISIFLLILLICLSRLSKNSHVEGSVILTAGIFSIVVMSMFDANFSIIFFILISIAFNIKRIDRYLKIMNTNNY